MTRIEQKIEIINNKHTYINFVKTSRLQDLKTVPTLCGHDALSKNKEDAKECADSTETGPLARV